MRHRSHRREQHRKSADTHGSRHHYPVQRIENNSLKNDHIGKNVPHKQKEHLTFPVFFDFPHYPLEALIVNLLQNMEYPRHPNFFRIISQVEHPVHILHPTLIGNTLLLHTEFHFVDQFTKHKISNQRTCDKDNYKMVDAEHIVQRKCAGNSACQNHTLILKNLRQALLAVLHCQRKTVVKLRVLIAFQLHMGSLVKQQGIDGFKDIRIRSRSVDIHIPGA